MQKLITGVLVGLLAITPLTAMADDFLSSEHIASGFTVQKLQSNLKVLQKRGNDLHDAKLILGVAEEFALAKNLSLNKATQLLVDAEYSKSNAIGDLDTNTKKLFSSGSDFSTLLKTLHNDNKWAIGMTKNQKLVLKRLGPPCHVTTSVSDHLNLQIWNYDCVSDNSVGRTTYTFVNGLLTTETHL